MKFVAGANISIVLYAREDLHDRNINTSNLFHAAHVWKKRKIVKKLKNCIWQKKCGEGFVSSCVLSASL
jgi:hypothetical protein